MNIHEPLLHGQFYHRYNCGINGETLFRGSSNNEHFLHLYDQYIESVAETYAWCLMGNHLHLLVRIKCEEEVGYYKYSSKLNADRSDDSARFKTTTDLSAFAEPASVKCRNHTNTQHHAQKLQRN